MTNTYRSLFTGKELDEAIVAMRSLVTPPLTTFAVTNTNANAVFSFDRKLHAFTKLSIVGTLDTGASYLETDVTCSPTTTPTIMTRPAVISGALSISATANLSGDIVQVSVTAPIGTILKIQPIHLI